MTVPAVAAESGLCDLPDRIVVAPGHGRVRLHPPRAFTTEGEVVLAGEVVAVLEAVPDALEVTAPCDAWVLAFLCRDGDRVGPGAPIVHLREL